MRTTRHIVETDIDIICDHRQRMFLEAGKDQDVVAKMSEPFRAWLSSHLLHKTYFGFIVESDANVIASIGLMAIDWPPHPEHPDEGHRGYVLNLFVEPQYRKMGLAKSLMSEADNEFLKRGISFSILHPTIAAKPIYESIGWKPSGELVKKLT